MIYVLVLLTQVNEQDEACNLQEELRKRNSSQQLRDIADLAVPLPQKKLSCSIRDESTTPPPRTPSLDASTISIFPSRIAGASLRFEKEVVAII